MMANILQLILGDKYEDVVKNSKKAEIIDFKKEAEKRVQEKEILSSYEPDKTIKATKTNLNKIIKWSSSRWNDFKKSDVVRYILEAIEKGEDTIEHYTCGTYTSRTGYKTGDYKLVIHNGIAKLIVNHGHSDQMVYKLER